MDKRSKFWLNNYKGFSKAKAEEHKINVYSKHGWERRIKVFSGILDNLLKSGKLKPGNEAVDFGCGTAMYSGIMKDSGLKVTAVDFCLDMLELAKEKRGNAIDYVNSDCSKLPFKDNAFDLAISFGMITIMTDPDPFFSELARVTKPGSLIMIMTLNKLFTSGIFHSERKRGIPLPEDISIIDYNPFHLKKRLEKNFTGKFEIIPIFIFPARIRFLEKVFQKSGLMRLSAIFLASAFILKIRRAL